MMFHRSNDESSPKARPSGPVTDFLPGDDVRSLRFEGHEFDLRRGELRAPDGQVIRLRPKTEELLRQFLVQPGSLLTKQYLLGSLWPKTVVTDDSLVQCVADLRAALGPSGRGWIRNVPRRGYRWEAKVERIAGGGSTPPEEAEAPGRQSVEFGESRLPATTSAPAALPIPQRGRNADPRRVVLIVALAGAVAGIAAAFGSKALRASPVHIDEEIAARGTVAVMPFVTADDDPVLRQVADSVADDIATQISSRIGMRGIGRAATSRYDHAAPPLETLARTLKAHYVIVGQAAHADQRAQLSVAVQLISTESGEVLWATRKSLDRSASAADDLGLQVANAVRNSGDRPDRAPKGSAPSVPTAVALTLQAWREVDTRKSPEDLQKARTHFAAALRDDPQSVIALNGLAATYIIEGSALGNPKAAEQLAEGERVMDRVRMIAPEDATALLLWSNLQMSRGHPELALPAIEKSLRLTPSYPNGHVLRAKALLLLGRTDEVQEATDRALALGKGDARRVSRAYSIASDAALMQGDIARARELAGQSVAAFPSNPYAHASLAAADALAGYAEDGAREVAKLRELLPGATVANIDSSEASTNPAFLAQRKRMYDGLRLAGLQER